MRRRADPLRPPSTTALPGGAATQTPATRSPDEKSPPPQEQPSPRGGLVPSVAALGAEVHSQLVAHQAANQARVAGLQRELSQCREELRELRQERGELMVAVSQLKVLEQALAKSQAARQAATQRGERQQQQLLTAQQENTELAALCQELEATVKQLARERDQQREELACLEDQLSQLQHIIGLLELKQQLC